MKALLTLPEELLLLAVDPESGRPRIPARHLGLALAGAVLADLEAAGHLAHDRGKATLVPPSSTGEPVLDAALALFHDGGPVRVQRWLRAHSGHVRDACAGSLAGRGAITVTSHRRLGIVPVHRYPQAAVDLASLALADFRAAAKLGFPDPRSRMLAALVSAARLTRQLPVDAGDMRQAHRTMRALRRELWPAQAVRRLIREEAVDGI